MEKTAYDKRRPKLDKVGCYFSTGKKESGFHFFTDLPIANGEIFIYDKGILWKLRK